MAIDAKWPGKREAVEKARAVVLRAARRRSKEDT